MKEAMYYKKLEKDNMVQCLLCPHHCAIGVGKVGRCQVRRNDDGMLVSINYEYASSIHMDPIEKKPVFHFYPGSHILSLGTLGCNLTCAFCQNSDISQLPKEDVNKYFKRMTQYITPQQVGEMAKKSQARGSIGIAYTYNEPSIWYEFVLESAREVKKHGMHNVLVTNGYLEPAPLKELLPYIDAANVDIKSMDDMYYRKLCGGRLAPILEYCKIAKEQIHIEITNLLVTGDNDSEENIQSLVNWVATNLGKDTPVHFSRYHPDYQHGSPPTPAEVLARAFEIASEKLNYVYVGNIYGGGAWENTRCPNCRNIVISRVGFAIKEANLKDGNHCGICGNELAIAGHYVETKV